ncbi:hypothetical protein GUITHDRAFT_146132 [Guillardia theta CCMP2712]|uniref:Uncharacterized protein n=1 Tax=Guillardia theta (strain CCMP2712) TaxID=905079 RepID=L1IJ84_GUITC|nr:hypothetical protein GUITHDRAFT_146132 [Guillardia theta CCMP2712]EKX35989.1 hypothetical protein GUITHDRAFT_146132 [Guillardia theta CCMP2712]|eukprot:XP_005822969.1 hypothetical protein GUITHDRAFT_146132 [Guillardia theta CCMP2712]
MPTSLELLLLLLLAWTSVGEAMESCRAEDGRKEVEEGPGEAISERARAALSSYEKLHARILDPREKKIKRKFLVLQPLLGMGNSQIEEATALLLAMQTRRALVIDLFDRRSHMDMDKVSQPMSISMADKSLFREHLYAQFNELVACKRWDRALTGKTVASRGRFLGYLPAYHNQHHGKWLRQTFGAFFFHFALNFLHRPSKEVKLKVQGIRSKYLLHSNCSIGIHIRWGKPSDHYHYVDHNRPEESLKKYLDCSLQLCPNKNTTVYLLATDSVSQLSSAYSACLTAWQHWVRKEFRKLVPDQALTEQIALGECDHIITTRLSTFSFSIHARANKRPWVVAKDSPSCKVLLSGL